MRDNAIWASDPAKFNDPFEYSYHLEPDLTFKVARLLNKKINTKRKHERIQRYFIKEGKAFIASCGGLYSLCEDNKISLMWSHYADSHKGFCVGYARRTDNILGTPSCLPVIYGVFPTVKVTDILKANLMSQQFAGSPRLKAFLNDSFFMPLIFEKMVLSKDANWSYEKEWRLMFVQRDQLVKIDAPICSITFGLRMPAEQKDQIRAILKKQPAVRYYQAYKPRKGYNVGVRRVA